MGSYRSGPLSSGPAYYGYFTPVVKWLLISNIGIFVLYFFCVHPFGLGGLFDPFLLRPSDVVGRGFVWQLVTYQFFHDPFGFGHIFWNMVFLFFFGADLERDWGSRNFLKYYLLCGIAAGICSIIVSYSLLDPAARNVPTLGASGSIYGVMFAYGIMMYPDRELMIWPLPILIKAKYLVIVLGAIEFMSSVAALGGPVNHVAHLGGMLFGFLYLKSNRCFRYSRGRTTRSRSGGLMASASEWYREYKIRRAKRRFEVYLKKRDSDRDRWVH